MMLPHVDEFRPVHNLKSMEGLISWRFLSTSRRPAVSKTAPQLEDCIMLNRDEDILKAAETWMKSGHGVALATVVETGLRAASRRIEPCHQ